MPLFNPPHPGTTLLEDVLPALNIALGDLATRLGVPHTTLSNVAHGKAPIEPNLARRLERAGISTARLWLAVQAEYDRWHAQHPAQPTRSY